jgi:hypothetical protein
MLPFRESSCSHEDPMKFPFWKKQKDFFLKKQFPPPSPSKNEQKILIKSSQWKSSRFQELFLFWLEKIFPILIIYAWWKYSHFRLFWIKSQTDSLRYPILIILDPLSTEENEHYNTATFIHSIHILARQWKHTYHLRSVKIQPFLNFLE